MSLIRFNDIAVSPTHAQAGETILVVCNVTNTGSSPWWVAWTWDITGNPYFNWISADSWTLQPGETVNFSGWFSMPSNDATIKFNAWYYDNGWKFSASRQASVTLHTAPPPPWTWTVTANVNPEGKPSRRARAGEVEVSLQYEWGWSAWTTDNRWIQTTNSQGRAVITTERDDMRFPGKYRVRALHLASGASVTREIHMNAYGASTTYGQQTENEGNEMPGDFAQRIDISLSQGRPWTPGRRRDWNRRRSWAQRYGR